ncbi:MAG: hypothetical protein K2H40_03120 [Lachnospiraceae bacterium]|nr:hypothetical protein [Lachnospiraceae bacterium]
MFNIVWYCVILYIVYRTIVRRKGQHNGKTGTGRPPEIHTAPVKHREQRTTRPQQRTNVQQPVKKPEAAAGSTMAYLEEKARQDQKEHAKEKWEETKRLNQNYGGLRVAQRLFEGDSVPGGQKCVVCDYCGAENLIPMMPRERYSCYFCREPLR